MKKRILFLFLMIGILSATGCSSENNDVSLKENSSTGNSQNDKAEVADALNLSVIDNGNLRCSSEQGYYYVTNDGFMREDGVYSRNMMYMDYATLQELYLCNRPGCEHTSEECPSVFSDNEVTAGSSLFYWKDSLYLFSHMPDYDGTSSIQNSSSGGLAQEGAVPLSGRSAILYRMNPDGTERQKVFEFENDETVEETVFASGNSLFFITKSLSSEAVDNLTTQISASNRKLIKVNTDNWEASEAASLETDWKLIGSTQNKLVFTKINFAQELSKEDYQNDNKYMEAYQNSKTSVIVLDLNDNKTEEVLTLPNDKLHTFAVSNGMLYIGNEGSGQIDMIDLESKEQSVFKETSANEIEHIYDGVLLCSKWDNPDAIEIDTTVHFFQLSDGTEQISNLTTSVMGTRIEIRAESESQFLVVYDYDAVLDTQYDNGQYTINGLKYALIDKADLYNGTADYNVIKMIGFGE